MFGARIRSVFAFAIVLHFTSSISIKHYSTPDNEPSNESSTTKNFESSSNLTTIERQKRLLPYVNFYVGNKPIETSHDRHRYVYVTKNNPIYDNPEHRENLYTPFLDSNALPGSFAPMPKKIKIQYLEPVRYQENLDFGSIYDKLSQLKTKRPVIVENYNHQQVEGQRHVAYVQNFPPKSVPPKTLIHTYTPTNIDIPNSPQEDYTDQYREKIPPQKPYVYKQIAIDLPTDVRVAQKPYGSKIYRKPIIIIQRPKQQYYNIKPTEEKIVERPVIYVKARPNHIPNNYLPNYEDQYQNYETSRPTPVNNHISNEDGNTLAAILKKLQQSNALPSTLTIENVDNSIKTLVKILNQMKKQQQFAKPIVVADENGEYHSGESHESIYPPDTEDGGTPGKPGIDYPALSSIPPTSFSCKTQRYKGFFGDPDTNCQVWHYCDLNGGQASFLCPNGTIFSQVALTCDWWYNVKCSSTPQLYVLNERLYKYILPLTPKFPEDYSGPLVDKYLALKFKEMEQKMEEERKNKENSEESTTSSEEETKTEEIQTEHNGKIEQTTLLDTLR